MEILRMGDEYYREETLTDAVGLLLNRPVSCSVPQYFLSEIF